MAASDGYINTYIDDCEGGVSGRKIATAAPKELMKILLKLFYDTVLCITSKTIGLITLARLSGRVTQKLLLRFT